MQSLGKFKPKLSQILVGVATGLLLLAVACGTAATATPPPTSAPTSGTPFGTAGPTPSVAPMPTSAPTGPVVNPGKLTWMIGSFGNERFDYTIAQGGTDYSRLLHGFAISSSVENGRRVMVPGILTKWELSSDSLSWILTIRKGVKFHDGTEVTAEDVVWSFQHIMGPQAATYALSGATLSPIMDRIEKTGPDQVTVTTKTPAVDFPARVSEALGGWTGQVLPKRATLHDENEEAAYDRNPIGAGIMKLVKHVPVEVMSFERFADYYYQPAYGLPEDRRVRFTTLDLRLVPEEATRVAALQAGDADIAPVSLGTRKQVEAGGGRVVFGEEGSYFEFRQLGCWKPQFPCHDKRVRQALNYAIDKQVMQNQLYGAEVMQAKGWRNVTPSTIGYSPELAPYPYDPAKARQLLAEAGYPAGKGFGKLVIDTWRATALPLMPEAAQLIADTWRRELGLDVEVKVGDEAALKTTAQGSEELHGHIWLRDNETTVDPASALRSYYINRRNDQAHDDPELLALAKEAVAVVDPVEREKVLNKTYLRLRDEAYDIALGYVNIPWGIGPRVLTWEPYPLAFYPTALHTITFK
jgi:peptide/nickel transport system substrate-binding protein